MEVCRSLYGYAVKIGTCPPYTDNLFAGLGGKRFKIEDAKPIFRRQSQTHPWFSVGLFRPVPSARPTPLPASGR